tara:strand:+ start:152 stop:364 length:213 start_codon:yes stop_codon:yes gene_type:complete
LHDDVNGGGIWQNYAINTPPPDADNSLAPAATSCIVRVASSAALSADVYITETILTGKPAGPLQSSASGN